MAYNWIKILHILIATMITTQMLIVIRHWHAQTLTANTIFYTTLGILPLALIQLIIGFTLISNKHLRMSDSWVQGCFVGFIITLIAWISFSMTINHTQQKALPSVLLALVLSGICIMLFFMGSVPK